MTGIKWSIKEEQGLGSLEPSMVATVRTGPDNKRFILVLDSGLKKSYCEKSGQNKPCSNGFARGKKKELFSPIKHKRSYSKSDLQADQNRLS